jgi:ABC-2 type transport system ATP-binding protein
VTAQISFAGATRVYGSKRAVDDLRLDVKKGSVVGFLGRNGAGKTTAIRMAMGLIRPTAGEVRVLGVDPWDMDPEVKRKVGYVSETQKIHEWMTVRKAVDFHASFYPAWDPTRERKLLERFELNPRDRVRELSVGTKKRLHLLLALCARPELLILDEPASNLDTVSRRQLLDVLVEMLAEGEATIFFSSHILTDLERIVSHVAILDRGRLLLSMPAEDFKAGTKRVRAFRRAVERPALASGRILSYEAREAETLLTVGGYTDATRAELARALGDDVEVFDLGLEDSFIAHVSGEAGRA